MESERGRDWGGVVEGRGREGAGLRVGRSQGRGGLGRGPPGATGGATGKRRRQPGPCTPSREICDAHDVYMCPRGDHSPRYQRLSETCAFAKVCAGGWGGALRLLARGEEGPGGPPREGKAAPAPRAALPSSPTSSTTRAPCCSPSSRRCGVSLCGTWGAAELHTQRGHAVRPLLSPGCSHRVPGVVEAGASPCGPAMGPVRVGRGPGEAEPVTRPRAHTSLLCLRGSPCMSRGSRG